jgi:hypothetical protein
MTVNRNRQFGLPHPWLVDGATLILPYPTQLANLSAPMEPFAFEVGFLIVNLS